MLVAQRQQGEKLSLIENWSKEQLLEIRKREDFYCPVCKRPVRLRLGEKKRFHFSHHLKEDCLVELENESNYHLEGKIKLYKWLQSQGLPVQLEKYLPHIQQRPDIFLSYKGKAIAIEYQCSTISSHLFQKRTASYQKANIHVIWILGGKCLKRRKSHTFHITPFQELFTTNYHHYELLAYCPTNHTFLKLGSSIYSFSPQTAISQLYVYRAENLTFPMLFTKECIPLYSIHREWCVKKKNWRMYLPNVYDTQMKSFLQQLYKAGITYIPAEVGVPTPSSFSLRTSPLLWQGYLFLFLLFPLKITKCCSLSQLCYYMNKWAQQGLIVFRQCLFHTDGDYTLIVKEYMDFLVARGQFQLVEEGVYEKRNEFTLPKTIEEACSLDYETTLLALRQQGGIR